MCSDEKFDWQQPLVYAVAILIISIALCVVPAIGRYIDRAQPAENLNLGIHADIEHGKLNAGAYGEKSLQNANDRPATALADGHE